PCNTGTRALHQFPTAPKIYCVGHKMSPETQTKPKPFKTLPAGVWALGFVSMFMDTSSELVHSLLPTFMATTLGASMVTIGMVEGVAEATAAITKIFSGALSDYWGKRKSLGFTGYALAACAQ